MNREKSKKLLAVFLSIALLISLSVGTCTFTALGATDTTKPILTATDSGALPTIISEEVSLREQGSKHFLLSDGTYTAVMYDEPVHYEIDGEWVEIDNSLVTATLVGEPLAGTIKRNTELTVNEQRSVSEEKTAYYENSANDFVVQVPKNIGNNTPVAITYKEHALRFCFNDIAEASSDISQPKNATVVAEELQKELAKTSDNALRAKIQNEYATAVQNNRSSVSYSAIKTDTDLTYYICGQTLKEDIILHSVPVEESYSFDFMFNGLEAVLQEDNSVIFYDNFNSPIFVIAAPVMFDSDEGYSADIVVVLEETQTGCRYTLEPNREWLEDESRVYPVTLDPQVTTTQNTNYIHDNGVQQSNPSTNYIASDRMYVGSGSGSYEGRIYFKLTQWPSATGLNAGTITSASLNLAYYPQSNWQTAYQMTVDVYKVSTAWNTNTITWNNQTGIGGTRISSKYISDARNKTSGYDSFDVTSWVKAHYSSPSTDYGIRLQPRTVVSSTNRACYISSDYYANTSLRPIIYINYFSGVKGVRNALASSYPDNPTYNCQSYAFWLTPTNGTNVFPQFTASDAAYCENTTVANALARTKTRMTSWLNTKFNGRWREVNSCDAVLNSNEWLVCMRVGVVNGQYDYHYWYRASDINWYNKHGYYAASEKVSGNVVNPSTANSSDGWKLGGTYFYTSSTVYYVIQQ